MAQPSFDRAGPAVSQYGPLRALAHRNFLLYFVGQGVSMIGTFMQQAALQWVVYALARSDPNLGRPAFWLGVVAFSGQIPAFFLAPLLGVFVDRANRHPLLLATQTLMMLQAFLLTWLAVTGHLTVGAIILLSVALGVVSAVDMPSRQAFLTDMLDRREDLANAIALNSSIVNGARLVGPTLAGLLLAATGAGFCFLLNALSYVAVLGALLGMRVRPRQRPAAPPPVLAGLVEGFRYSFGFRPIRALLLLLALVSLMSMSYSVLLPVFADRVLHGGPSTYGYLLAAAGVGALGAAVYLASRHTVLGLGKWIAASPAALGAALIVFALSHVFWLSLLALFVAGAAMMLQMAASNTVLQTIVEEDKRGRVMSLYTMAFMGMAPLGSLLAGWLAEWLGAPVTVGLAGAACIVGALLFATVLPDVREKVRPIYRRMGILPEVAAGIQTATQLNTPPERA
jgi:MFS family permease